MARELDYRRIDPAAPPERITRLEFLGRLARHRSTRLVLLAFATAALAGVASALSRHVELLTFILFFVCLIAITVLAHAARYLLAGDARRRALDEASRHAHWTDEYRRMMWPGLAILFGSLIALAWTGHVPMAGMLIGIAGTAIGLLARIVGSRRSAT